MNVFELLGTIAINNKGANKGIDETATKAKNLANTFGQLGREALRVGKTVAKGMAAISAAGTAAVSLLMKNSIGEYAEYQQLVGGIETLFKDSQDKVKEYAKNAYKTAGISANDYMATATSFSASLLQGLSGDTEAAATMTNLAIHDMADNANKMGTDISMIQNAYQGFAKQNFTMLDNLKLGYGGTAAEMARLINDSGVMGETMVVTAETLNEVSFAKIIEAIHVVQKEMGIAETSADEVRTTITGSFNAWKASGSNLLTAIASGDEKSIQEATAAFTAQTQTLLDNLGPVVTNVATSIGTLLTELLPDIGQQALNFGSDIIANIVNGITGSSITSEDVKAAINTILDIGSTALDNTLVFIKDALGWITDNKELVVTALTAIGGAFLVFKMITDPIGTTINLIAAGFLLMVTNWENFKAAIKTAGEEILKFFGVDPEAFYQLVEDIGEAWNTYVVTPINNAIAAIKDFLGINTDKTVTVTYKQQIQETAASIGATVAQQTGSEAAGAQAEQNMMTFITNPDSNYNFGALFGGLFKPVSTNASGLRYVPRDGHISKLHMGEMVLPRHEADEYRSGRDRGMDISRLETAVNSLIALVKQLVANTAGGTSVVLDTGVLVGQMAPRLDAQLGTLTARKGRRG